jgi:hypothetical protein
VSGPLLKRLTVNVAYFLRQGRAVEFRQVHAAGGVKHGRFSTPADVDDVPMLILFQPVLICFVVVMEAIESHDAPRPQVLRLPPFQVYMRHGNHPCPLFSTDPRRVDIESQHVVLGVKRQATDRRANGHSGFALFRESHE